MQQITIEEITPNLTQEEWIILNDNIEFTEARRKAASVLRYLKKHILLNAGSWSKSFKTIWNMYKRYHNYISLSHLKNIVTRLEELKLITINKEGKKNIYFLPVAEEVAEEVAKDENITPEENEGLQEEFEKPRYPILDKNYTILDTYKKNDINLISMLKKFYKGVKPSLIATKKQLRDIVQATLVAKGISGNNSFHKAIQFLVFKKIKYSNQKINLIGAVSYIEKVIEDRIEVYNNNLVQVPGFINSVQNNMIFNDFPQRSYDYDSLEKQLLGWK